MNTVAYLAIGISAIIGLVTGIVISPKRKSHKGEEDNGLFAKDNSTMELQEQIQTLQTKCNDLKQIADLRTAELANLQKQVVFSEDAEKDVIIKIQSENEEKIKKLKRELEIAEEDLEDAESTAKKHKRQLEEKVSENSLLIDKISAAKRSINDLTSSLEATKDDLKVTSKQLDSVSRSLSFIQEILTAKPLSNETLSKKNIKITALSNFIFFDLQELFKQFFSPTDLSKYIFGQGLRQWETIKRKSWIEGKKTIAFIGEFSAGKTSIVNRILSQDDPSVTLLPVSAKATTAIPTYIAGGDFTTYQFYTPDGHLKGISEDSFKKVSKEILGNIDGVSELIKFFVMTYQNPYLTGMSILDTPGFSSGDQEDAIRTIDVINECDALFWVFDVVTGTVNRSSLDVIKTNMTRPLYVIINKIDLKSRSEVNKVEACIRKDFADAGIEVKGYIRFSSTTPLNELMKVIESIPNDNSATEYLTILKDDFIPSLIKDLENIHKDSNNKLDSSNKKCDEKLNDIMKNCNRIENRIREAAHIPHYEKHWISANRYEMNDEEFNKQISLLNRIADSNIKTLSAEITEYGEFQRENQKVYEKNSMENSKLLKFREYQSKVNRLIADLNR